MCGTTDVQKFVEADQVLKKRPLVEETCEDVPLRSGKWTHEEERYAASLIEHFESGKLTDCEEGETLRAYLSRKLHCIPMRVSKKYAGQCIGKVTSTYWMCDPILPPPPGLIQSPVSFSL
jgi:hypothetical protein